MSELPSWIDNRLDQNLDNALSQKHVVETMVDSERPFFSARQLQALVKPDVSKATVRNRLNELQEIDIVATETYPESVTLYYEGVIELFSHRDDRASRIVSTFVVGDSDDETKTQSEKHLCSCVDAASGVRSPEAAVLH